MLDHEPVPDKHAALIIFRGKGGNPVGGRHDGFIGDPRLAAPVLPLMVIGKNQPELYLRTGLPETENLLRREQIEAARAAAFKHADPLTVRAENGVPDQLRKQRQIGGIRIPVPGKAGGDPGIERKLVTHDQVSIFRTARKASLGT